MNSKKFYLIAVISLIYLLQPGFTHSPSTWAYTQSSAGDCVSPETDFKDYESRRSPDYPGVSSDGRITYSYARHGIQLGLIAYYRVYAEWPKSWQQVVEAGLFQVPLVGYFCEPINPDDPSLDFVGDLYYDSTLREDNSVRVMCLAYREGSIVDQIVVEPPVIFTDMFTAMDAIADYGLSCYLEYPNWLKFFAIRTSIINNLDNYRMLNDEFPEDIIDFLDSELGPIDANSINPLTGDYFYFDGRPLNFFYERVDEKNYRLWYADECGELIKPAFYP